MNLSANSTQSIFNRETDSGKVAVFGALGRDFEAEIKYESKTLTDTVSIVLDGKNDDLWETISTIIVKSDEGSKIEYLSHTYETVRATVSSISGGFVSLITHTGDKSSSNHRTPALPLSYISNSSGTPYISGDNLSIKVPGLTAVSNGSSNRFTAEKTLTPELPNVEIVATEALSNGGVMTIASQPQHLAKLQITVNAVSEAVGTADNFVIAGNDERGIGLEDTVYPSTSISIGSSDTVVSNKYFASITSITANGMASGVTASVDEHQFRGHLKLDSTGSIDWAWDNTYSEGEQRLCSFECLSTGIISIQDWRLMGPIAKAQRIGSEVLEWSGGFPEGPNDWFGNCIYTAIEAMDGNLIIAGNGGRVCEFDGLEFDGGYRPSVITALDNISSIASIGRNANEEEIFYVGTYSGLLLQWNRTANVWTDVTPILTTAGWASGAAINAVVKGGGNNLVYILGADGAYSLIDNNNTTPSIGGLGKLNAIIGSDEIFAGVYADNYLWIVGGGASGIRFIAYQVLSNYYGIDLSDYLPGAAADHGGSSASLRGISVDQSGNLVFCGVGSSFYMADWSTRQSFGRGLMALTLEAGNSGVLPAGFTVSDGANTYKTLYDAECSHTGTPTIYVEVEAVERGMQGMAVAGTVTTVVDSWAPGAGATRIGPVNGSCTNSTAISMGRLIANGTWGTQGLPKSIISSQTLAVRRTAEKTYLSGQGGDVFEFDGSILRDITPQVQFKGRNTTAILGRGCIWMFGDEGKIFSLPI